MRAGSVGIVALAGALLAGCGREAPVTTLVPVLRVIDALAPVTPGVVHGVDVKLGLYMHRTVMLPASVPVLATLDAAANRYRVQVGPAVATWPGVRVVRQATINGGKVTLHPVTLDLAAGVPNVPVAPFETPAPDIAVALYAASKRRSPSVETVPFTVPPGAVLRFAVGTQGLGTRVPDEVDARVSVVEGRSSRTVWRGTRSGADEAWRDVRASLAAYATRRVRLRFTTRPRSRASEAGVFAIFGEPVVLAARRVPTAPFNVVLVSMDTLRARSLGAYGSARPTSPALDALAADGALLENAFSTAAFTLPGHLSMLTGLWFRTHGALEMTWVLPPGHRTLAEVLQSAGYATGAFSSGAWIVPWVGFRRGFDAYYELNLRESPLPDEPFRRGIDWMRANADRPFFAFLHNYGVHAPYLPPPPYDRMFEPLAPGAPDVDQRRLAYEREVRYADDQLRGLLEGLEGLGVADRTLVIVTSDHGEQFGEHGGVEHTYDLHDEVVHVPLVMRLPGAIPAGRRIAEPTSLADIVPTVVDLLGLPPVHGADGASLLPLLAGTAERLPRGGVFSEAASEPKLGWVDLVAVHTRAVSCIHDARRATHECWDRRRDPWQELAPLPRDAASREVAEAQALLGRFEAAKPPPGTPPAAAPRGDAGEQPAGVDAERREQLRALGYVE